MGLVLCPWFPHPVGVFSIQHVPAKANTKAGLPEDSGRCRDFGYFPANIAAQAREWPVSRAIP